MASGNDGVEEGLSLDKLPSEILHAICTQLCCHCCKESLDDYTAYLGYDYNAGRGLDALALSCKRLRSIALPYCFHYPKNTKLTHFIRTVKSQPDGVNLVKALNLSRGNGFYGEDFKYCKEVARGLQMEIEGDPDFEAAEEEDISEEAFYDDLWIASCPKVETMRLEIHDYGGNYEATSFKFVASRLKRVGESAQLKSLRYLKFSKGEDFGYPIDNPGVSVILGAAPCLEHLAFEGTPFLWDNGFDPEIFQPGLQNLLTLEFTRCAIEDDDAGLQYRTLQGMTSLCRQLRAFEFMAISPYIGEAIGDHLAPARFLQALESQRPTLQRLDLDLSDCRFLHGFDTPASCQIDAAKLAPFRQLHTLRLDETCFCRHWFKAEAVGALCEHHTCLTELLSATVTHLAIKLHGEWPAFQDILHLGRRVAAGKFPALRTVDVLVIFDRKERFTKEFREEEDAIARGRKEVEEAFANALCNLSFRRVDMWDDW